ncbi:NAD(P)H-hydrate dehydratase [Campylobacter sp. 19-13652]|uniref:NAD(P)H-hydrate dehydratase n=1 Tax=Campylobacter sp. 19-13652 TaxID=2840180 RepID=UPI001C78EF3D|nr:NAD(P)H-hydrate dehydratase [Campylobacter sp. 19-13652]BCX78654.1 bifunctional NAD(P)H-hydrate repair enzyme Nnr [Campylobacter sp. 19-13652]
MLKIYLNTSALDKRACDKFALSEDLLQENAAYKMALVVRDKFKPHARIFGVCGGGNNGADVLASLRMLSGEYKCAAYLLFYSEKIRPQLERAVAAGVSVVAPKSLQHELDFLKGTVKFKKLKRTWLKKAECVIDGIFGSGLNRTLQKPFVKAIKKINEANKFIISCDLPSGLNAQGNIMGAFVRADVSVCMGVLKLGLFSDMAKDFVGKIVIANLGISAENFCGKSDFYLLQKSDLSLPFRDKNDTNKGSFGHVFALAGEHTGACIMALKSAFCFGAGLVSAVSKNKLTMPKEIMQTSYISPRMNAGVIGSGLGKMAGENELIKVLVNDNTKLLVIDADMFYDEIVLGFAKRKNCVLTPHPKEFSALLKIAGFGEYNVQEVQENRFKLAREFSLKFKATLVLKGANTIIAKNGKLYIMPLGVSALAKGGSGDVLSGLIAGLLAQGYTPLKAAINGTLAHAISARKYKKANYSLTPKQIIKGIKCLVKK